MKEKILSVFSHGQLQDALNLMFLMEKYQITTQELKDYIGKAKPFTRRLSRKQREREFKRTRWGRRRK